MLHNRLLQQQQQHQQQLRPHQRHTMAPSSSCICLQPQRAAPAQQRLRPPTAPRRGAVVARAQGGSDENPDKDLESLFSKELKRRGLDSLDDVGGWTPKEEAASASTSTSKSPFATQASPRTAAAGSDTEGGGDQRQRSIAMVNEGLEGLIPRATELLKLGGSVFLAFVPFMLAFSLLFSGIYLTFGSQFVHGGSSGSGPPPYVDPATLLSEPTVDPTIPFMR